MIIQRIVRNARQRDWFDAALELVIVVVGIFIGLQVSSWNESRLNSARGAELTQRLSDELTEEAVNYSDITRYQISVRDNVVRLLEAIGRPRSERDYGALLTAAYRATQFQWYPSARGTFDEVVASGDMGLVDNRLMSVANRFYNIKWIEMVYDEEQNSPYRAHFRGLTDYSLQRRLAAACGDTVLDETARLRIDYPCEFSEFNAANIEAFDAFLNDPKTLALLRLRAASLDTYIANYDYNFGYYGLDQFAPKGEITTLSKR